VTLNPTMFSRDDARHYYATLFPAESVFCLLEHSSRPTHPPSNREFGIETLDGKFRRWKSCSSPADLRRLLVSSETGKLNIGAVYETSVSNRFKRDRGGEYTPMNDVGAELKFDIDLDDYTHLGTAKHDLDSCDSAWPVLALGLEVLKRLLEINFGFKKFLAVYSGRRGAHLWVFDRRAFGLSNEARSSIVAWLQPQPSNWFNNAGNAPYLASVDIVTRELVLPFFETKGIIDADEGGLGLLDAPPQRQRFVDKLGIEQSVINDIRGTTPAQFLRIVLRHVMQKRHTILQYEAAVWDLVCPRLDANVTKDRRHTLKSVFSLHPSTGRLSVPIFGPLGDFDPKRDAISIAKLLSSKKTVAKLSETISSFQTFVARTGDEDVVDRSTPPLKPPSFYDLKLGIKTDNVKILYESDRIAVKIERAFVVNLTEDKIVKVKVFQTRLAPPFKLRAHQFPSFDFENPTKQAIVDRIASVSLSRVNIQQFVAAVKTVFIVGPEAETQLPSEFEVCTLNLKWGKGAIVSFLSQKLEYVLADMVGGRTALTR